MAKATHKKTQHHGTPRPSGSPLERWSESRWFPWGLAAVYSAVLLFVFREFVFSDLMLYGSDTMQAVVYFRSFYVDAIQSGQFPEWSPYQFGGMPFVDAFHSDIFYPFSSMKFFLPLHRTRGWEVILHFLLGGMNMYAAARAWDVKKLPAAVAGLAYMLAPYFMSMVHPGHDGKIYVIAWFPLGFVFLKYIWDRGRTRDMAIFGLIVGLIILTPHVQMAYFALWAYALYSVYRIVLSIRESGTIPWLKSVGALAAVFLALGISAIQFYPSYDYVKTHSPRSGGGRGFDYAASWSLHPEEIVGEVVPEFAGVAGVSSNTYWGRNAFKDNSEYGGLVILLLAVFAVFRTRFKDRWFFFGLGIFATLYALGAHTPLFTLFYNVVPNVKQMRAPAMIMFVYVFSIAICAAVAMDRLCDHVKDRPAAPHKSKLLWVIGGVLAVMAFLMSVAPAVMMSAYTSIFYSDISPARAAAMQSNMDNISLGFWIAAFLALSTAYLSFRLLSRNVLWPILALGALVFLDGSRMNHKFIKTIDLDRFFPHEPVVDFLKAQPQPIRVVAPPGGFRTNYFALNGIAEMTGYHGNQLRAYNDLLGGTGQTRMFSRQALDLCAIEYIVFRRGANLDGDPADPAIVKVFDQGGVVAFRNTRALPRARLVSCWERRLSNDSLYSRLFEADYDYRGCALVEEDLPFASSTDTVSPGSAEIVRYARESIEIDVQANREALMILSDNAYPAWHATLDGIDVPIITTNATFRGVVVPEGTHKVRFEYRSQRLVTGAWITLFSTLLCGLVIGLGTWRHTRTAE